MGRELINYRGFLISGWAQTVSGTGSECFAQGGVYRNGKSGSIIEVKRFTGPICATPEEAERKGLGLAKKWIDGRQGRRS